MTRNKFKRIVAFFLAINIFFEVVSPSVALALTSGPGQPEMASFEPVGTTEMVDVFSGDFNYNIPLLTVPGPNGGYPVNLAYHSGIGMEEEASWVGLGWNINAGSVTRDMRGLPDDFNGDGVVKQQHMKANKTVGISFGLPLGSTEVWGLKFQQNMGMGLAWNNYQGIGFTGSFGVSASKKSSAENNIKNSGLTASVNMSYNSLAGETNLVPALSFSTRASKAAYNFGLSFNVNSLSGLKDLSFSSSVSKINSHTRYEDDWNNLSMVELEGQTRLTPGIAAVTEHMKSGTISSSTSFASSGFVPSSIMPQKGINVSAMFSLGVDAFGVYGNFFVNGDYDKTENKISEKSFESYGYLYSSGAKNFNYHEELDNYKLMDFNREKEAALNRDIPNMPVPVYTHDVFMVKGQGTGGIFRAFRNDISLLRDPEITGETFGGALGVETGAGYPTFNFGINTSVNYSRSYSGPWKDKDLYNSIFDKTFTNSGVYFKSPNDLSASTDDEPGMITGLSKFQISRVLNLPQYDNIKDATEMLEVFNPFADFKAMNSGVITQSNYNTKRARSQLMSYRTISEINEIPDYKKAWVESSIENGGAGYTNDLKGHQIGEISVTNPDGNRYIYALPAVNKVHKESTFSIGQTSKFFGNKITNYQSDDNSLKNNQLDDEFYSSTSIPAYAHNYLLTAIVAPDYVDLTGDGPSDDDFGYWVKFKYEKTSSAYQWRTPLNGANYLNGYLSTNQDDKAGLIYGKKEIWYLKTIETKTHISKFQLENRDDGYAAKDENNIYTGSKNIDESSEGQLKLLRKISLYSKNDLVTPLKEVNFTYDYSLCKNLWNNKTFSGGYGAGKLTLKKISFSYLGNAKGTLSPYVFNYGESDTEQNPSYEPSKFNRWGSYQPDKYNVDNTLYPFVFQKDDYNEDGTIDATDVSLRNKHASAWNLKEITLPSGGKIKVDYESDDYAYVHDKTAMEMVKIFGFGRTSGGPAAGNKKFKMNEKNDYLFFELDNPSMTTQDVGKMIEGVDDMYFNVYTELKKNGIEGILKKDYVNGYAKIDHGSGTFGVTSGNPKLGFVRVIPVKIKDVATSISAETHPFKKAGWQYLKLERKDVLFPGTNNSNANGGVGLQFLKQVANATIGAFQSSTQLFMGYYNYCATAGYCDEMSYDRPSFIRLNCHDGRKYGGGHRVKKIAISDTWQETNLTTEQESTYGQEYNYILSDGTSSGVAAYEPLIGGEEIPQRQPIRYSSPYFIFKNHNLYMEEPVGESYYPAGSVGYSRVVVKNIDKFEDANQTVPVTKTKEGKTVYEFYTTKDFPFSITRTNLEEEHFKPKFPIPFIGNISFNNYAYSQGMSVTTNDMHGHAKSVATYGANSDLDNPSVLPVSKTEFIYNTSAPYSPSGANTLNSKFDCLFDDGVVRKAEMGSTHENFIDMKQNSSVYMKQGVQTNVDITFFGYVPTPFFSMMPIIDYAESMFKSVVKMEVNSQTAVLMETRAFNEGSTMVTKNLLFDANNGKPLLTTVTNNFDKPVFKYEYSAAWAYKELGNAYKNDRETFDFTLASGHISLAGGNKANKAKEIFCLGDEVLVKSGSSAVKCWVTNILNVNDVELMNENGSLFSSFSGSGYIIKSGYRNQQSVSNGFIVSLTNPVTDKVNYFFDGIPQPGGTTIGGYNNMIYNATTTVTNTSFVIPSCDNPTVNRTYDVTFDIDETGSSRIIIVSPGTAAKPGCDIIITFDESNKVTAANWWNFKLKKVGNKIYATRVVGSTTETVIGKFSDGCGIVECLDGVLQASASQFKSDWTYDYIDIGNPAAKYTGSSSSTAINTLISSSYNPYRLGMSGIWRMDRSWVYQNDRKQTDNTANINATKIQEDGTFANFTVFDWNTLGTTNKNSKWTNVNTVTRYNPYGFEVENKNAIGISSAAIYGYNNTTQTAITANSEYYETGFDGFEDYNSTTSMSATSHGHIKLVPNSGNVSIVSTEAHTGSKSIAIAAGQKLSVIGSSSAGNYFFRPLANKKYFVSAWFKSLAGKPNVTLQNAIAGTVDVVYGDVIIEGWQKIEVSFVPASSLNPVIEFSNANSGAVSYLDDIRIQPFLSTMKTFVYHPKTLWLLAELDNQNYATFYNYDEEGTLTQVKKETVKGVQTLKTTRSNIRKLPAP